jgi:hypothetical protein
MANTFNWTGTEEFVKNVSFPICFNSSLTFIDGLTRKMESYKTFIKLFKEKNPTLDIELVGFVDSLWESITQCINLYYRGSAWAAYHNLISELLNFYHALPVKTLVEENHLFRMRVSLETLKKNNEIFHIPFSKRYLVESQRFSIGGLPCLYLGSSHFVCWYELNKPNFNNLYTASFKPLQTLKLLDISQYLPKIKESISNSEIESYLISYPLTIACNIETKYLNAKFNEESHANGKLIN